MCLKRHRTESHASKQFADHNRGAIVRGFSGRATRPGFGRRARVVCWCPQAVRRWRLRRSEIELHLQPRKTRAEQGSRSAPAVDLDRGSRWIVNGVRLVDAPDCVVVEQVIDVHSHAEALVPEPDDLGATRGERESATTRRLATDGDCLISKGMRDAMIRFARRETYNAVPM